MSTRLAAIVLLLMPGLLAASCGKKSGNADGPASDGGANEAPVAEAADSMPDTGTADATPGVRFFPRRGDPGDSTVTPQGPGLVLLGGNVEPEGAFVWMRSAIGPATPERQGDLVILRALGEDTYDHYVYTVAKFSSVQTALIVNPAPAESLAQVAALVDHAEAVFMSGGAAADYLAWAGTPVMTAVQALYNRGGIVAGSGTAMNALGQFAFTATGGAVTSLNATTNPFLASITFAHDMLALPPLANAICDSHFVQTDRFGRLATFMARLVASGSITGMPPRILGVGVSEKTALLIDKNGVGTVQGEGAAFLIRGGAAMRLMMGMPLLYPDLTVTRLEMGSATFDFKKLCGTGPTYMVTVDGTKAPPYVPRDPYGMAASAGTCP